MRRDDTEAKEALEEGEGGGLILIVARDVVPLFSSLKFLLLTMLDNRIFDPIPRNDPSILRSVLLLCEERHYNMVCCIGEGETAGGKRVEMALRIVLVRLYIYI